jgi:hypothetical protein
MNFQKHIDRARKIVVRDLLPDTCTITSVSDTPTISALGVPSFDPVNLTYNSSESIPCHLRPRRAFINEKGINQEVNVNDYVLLLPFDVLPKPNDKIIVNGRTFEARKLNSNSNWTPFTEVLVTEVEYQHD